MFLETIYKKTKTGKTQEWQVEVEGCKYRTIAGQSDGKKVTSEWTVCHPKNEGKANATTGEEQAIKEAHALRNKKLERDYHESVDNIEIKRHFEPMLAEKWEDRRSEISYPIYSQPKLDGIRCIVKSDGMWTRAGKPIISAPHIFNSLKPLFDTNPHLIFDGELYCDKLANDFNKIVSLVKKSKPTEADLEESAKTIQYHIYDLPSVEARFSERLRALSNYWFAGLMPDCCVLVKTDVAVNESAVERLYGEYVDAGYEGQMLRVSAFYENKRSKYLLKHKTFTDEEYTILEIHEGEGNRTGTAGYMVFERNGNRFKSNIKGTFEYCQEVWQNRESLIGKRATVKYFNLTPAGIPRFPYVTKIDRESYE
jgi:DNA ligase-1